MYIGPETIMPVASALAALLGVLLMVWHRLVAWIRAGWRVVFRRRARPVAGRGDEIGG